MRCCRSLHRPTTQAQGEGGGSLVERPLKVSSSETRALLRLRSSRVFDAELPGLRGARRSGKQLNAREGPEVARCTVERLMREPGPAVVSVRGRSFKVTTHAADGVRTTARPGGPGLHSVVPERVVGVRPDLRADGTSRIRVRGVRHRCVQLAASWGGRSRAR